MNGEHQKRQQEEDRDLVRSSMAMFLQQIDSNPTFVRISKPKS